MTISRLTITRPDDWHLHLRDGEVMASILSDTARRFGRAIVMPNLKPPVTTTEQALSYRDRILKVLPAKNSFKPLMTLYLTDATTPAEIIKAKSSGFVHAVKYYPAHATTNSEFGVSDIKRSYPIFASMEEQGLLLLVHGEVTDHAVDIFDRERVFIERYLTPLSKDFPKLRIVMEHITTKEAVKFVGESSQNIAATITAHHLLLNRNAIFDGGIRPHHYCLPVLKREIHRQALVEAAISGNKKFFLGTDSAPHPRRLKEATCGCAGIYTAHAAIELYAEAFEQAGALEKLEAFASFFGPDFYQLARNKDNITIEKKSWVVPDEIKFGNDPGVPLRAGGTISWKLAD